MNRIQTIGGVAAIPLMAIVSVTGGELTTHKLKSWGNGAPEVTLKLSGEFEIQRSDGPDFDLHYLVSRAQKIQIGVYQGRNPSRESEEAKVTSGDGEVGGRKVSCKRWNEDGRFRSS